MRRLVNQRKSIHQLGPAAAGGGAGGGGAARSSFQFVGISQRRFLERWSPSLLPSFLPLLS